MSAHTQMYNAVKIKKIFDPYNLKSAFDILIFSFYFFLYFLYLFFYFFIYFSYDIHFDFMVWYQKDAWT